MKKITLLLTLTLVYSMNMSSQTQLLSESFDDITTLTSWDKVNVSTGVGLTTWFQGNPATFVSQAGADNSYIGANFNATTGASTISNWLILPVLSLKDGDVLTFYTRTVTGGTFPDRLQVRISGDGAASTPPANPTDLGSYTTLLLDINPTLVPGPTGYPDTWTLQTVSITGLGATAVDARLAFRYFVSNGGPSGANSNFIGIDTLSVDSTLSVDEFASNNFKHFYTSDTHTLTLKSSASSLSVVEIFNVLGQEVLRKNLSKATETVNLSGLQDGVYLAKVMIEGQMKTVKFLKN